MSSLQAEVVANSQAAWQTYCLAFASTSIVIWDHVITFGREVEYFWTGDWNISTVLYLSIRYIALLLAGISIYIHRDVPTGRSTQASEAYDRSIDHWLFAGYILVFVVILLCQAVVALRVWYLFSRNRFVRVGSFVLYAGSVIGCSVLGAREWYAVEEEFNNETDVAVSTKLTRMWYIFFPALVVHTALFLCKIWRVLESKGSWKNAPVMRRMLKDVDDLARGAVMYSFATATLLFSVIGLSDVNNPLVYQPALLGNFAVAATVVSVCRAMLNIKSLAATWHVEPAWLLNHAELSRVQWRRGGKEGELVVEIGGSEGGGGIELCEA
ncbi:hypothetical protein BS17DRAFT_811812 [Gyrodon lividus]|nr:hypothetical protein BS17DRAFT_811812 [Gyrodon lividus]